MDTIHLLPDSVANQIAAGEVIQRPSSLVKELVENAVDAGARHIDVIATGAGRTSLQVVDDGCGMSATDARLCFERHATSKIRKAADLFSLTTMGFRGEALPSIAAVAQVELQTRTADSELGTLVRIEGSRVVTQEPVACPVGSNFLVRNLFFNVPARRKFLKADATELTHIVTEMERIVLVNEGVAFTLTADGGTLLSLSPGTRKQRIAAVFGQRLADGLLAVDVETPMVSIHGFVGLPATARRRGARQFFFANGRYMRHPYFHRAIQEAFARLVEEGEQVPYFLFIDVPPADIDVNIHPTKTEIKFENEQAIWQILLAALREALARSAAIPTMDFDVEGRPESIPVYNPLDTDRAAPRQPVVDVNPSFNPFHPLAADGPSPSSYGRKSAPQGWEQLYAPPAQQEIPPAPLTDTAEEPPTSLAQYRGQYLLSATAEGLVLTDQHRAHLRILYDRYLAQSASAALPSQRLLFPDVVRLSATDAARLSSVHPALQALGFDLSDLGGGAVSILGIPSGLEGLEPRQLLQEMLASAGEGREVDADVRSRMALALARAAAIPVGQLLSAVEQDDLLRQLAATADPVHTPDGRTIQTVVPQDSIDKLFR